MNKDQFLQSLEDAKQNGNSINGESFENFELNGVDLDRVNVTNCVFNCVNFNNCKLRNSAMHGNNFVRCELDACNFENVRLQQSYFVHCNLTMTVFDNCDCQEIKIENGNWNVVYWMSVNMENSQINGTILMRSIIQGSNMLGIKCEHCEFEDDRFMRSSISHAKFLDTQFLDTSLDEVSDGKIPDTEFLGCVFVNSIFAQMNLDGIRFHRCKFRAGNFGGASLMFADFEGSEVNNSNFRQCRFKQTNFVNVDLSDAIFDENLPLDSILVENKPIVKE